MELLILRHGIAEDLAYNDAARRLTEEGRRKVVLAARGLDTLDVVPTHLWTSPLTRALETAEALGLGLEIEVRDELAMAPLAELVDALRELPDTAAPLLIGHEPQLSGLAESLIGARTGAIRLKKAGLIWLSVDLRRWPMPPATLQCLLTPAQLRGLGTRS